MAVIEFAKIRAIGRDCPHPNCGVVFEISRDQLATLDPARQSRCRACGHIIRWAEIQRIKEILERVQELRNSAMRYRFITEEP
ncbi:MAG: hypothetical protein HY423_00155 [Candidatus Lambdaproteobacteria bacterium]|nr:hypothetical protein [Candidatus Lambdaproteobacteria bacterium]